MTKFKKKYRSFHLLARFTTSEKNFPNKTLCGFDGIPPTVLESVAKEIAKPMADLANMCFQQGVFPEIFNHAKLIPIHKKGSKHDIKNCRPVSLLPVFSKILERLIYNRLFSFLQENKILNNFQLGFIKGKNTENAIFEALHHIIKCIDSGENLVGIYFDLSKAFDSLEKNILLNKMYCYGARSTTLSLLDSYLTERTQTVCIKHQCDGVIKHYYSNKRFIKKGVPQSSILGPLLFLLYVNEVSSYIGRPTFQYADDWSCIISANKMTELSCTAADTIYLMERWCNENALHLNDNKTVMVQFINNYNSKGKSCIYVPVNGKSVPISESVNFFPNEFNCLPNSASRRSANCNRVRKSMTFRTC